MTYQQLTATWPTFSQNILQFMRELSLDKLMLACDHAALRVNSTHAAQQLQHEFAKHGTIISNNMINGRPILIIELTCPMQLGHMVIDCVELPFPGDKIYSEEGWEHIELVLNSTAQTCETLRQELLTLLPDLQAIFAGDTEIDVKMSSPKGDKERLANPTIAFKKAGLCIKVHPHSIKAIIASER